MCAYCKKSGHDEHHFYLKKIDELKYLLKKNSVKLPDAYKEKDSTSKEKGKSCLVTPSTTSSSKGRVLIVVVESNSYKWILDSRASHHMTSFKNKFT